MKYFLCTYTNELKSWLFGKAGAKSLNQQSGAEAAQPETVERWRRVQNLGCRLCQKANFSIHLCIYSFSWLLASQPISPPQRKMLEPSAAARFENNIFLEGAFLYWTARQEGNEYAVTGNAITVPGTVDPNTALTPSVISTAGKLYAPDTEIKPGYRLGFGMNLEHGCWDILSEYTYLFSKGDHAVASNNLNAGILPIFSYTPNNSILRSATFATTSGATGFVSAAEAYWSLHFNTITLELGRTLQPTTTLSLRPHFGLQGAWHEQKFQATYTVSSFTTFASTGNNEVAFEQNSWGIGGRAGLDGVWKCCNHLGVFFDSALAALWGCFEGRGKSYDTKIGTYSHVLIGDQKTRIYTVSPVIQILIGLQTDWQFYGKYLFLAQAGWEEQIWFNQNQHSSTLANTSLVLQGLTLKFQFDF